MKDIQDDIRSNFKKLQDIRLIAELHWDYTKLIIEKTLRLIEPPLEEDFIERFMDFAKTLYIEPFIHGYKHRLDEEGLIK